MTENDIEIGLRVKSNTTFVSIPEGTEGVLIEDYGSGITIAWDKEDRPYPKELSCDHISKMYAIHPLCPHRDGFDKDNELQYLDIIKQ